jgi:hypothetical protein
MHTYTLKHGLSGYILPGVCVKQSKAVTPTASDTYIGASLPLLLTYLPVDILYSDLANAFKRQ